MDRPPRGSGSSPDLELVQPGTLIADRYRVLSKIAEGGMGVLYACDDTVLGRQVAVKLMQRSLASEPQVSERLLREARLAAQLRQHVVQIFDCGTLDTGEPYIVMELLRGHDLFSVLKASGPLSPEQVANYLLEVCVGLAEAHGKGIIHRDLKPENLFCSEEPDGSTVLKIVDFGVSKQLSHARVRSQTNPSESVGSPQYMSPEQIMTPSEVDTRTDIWSLGVVIFELLTGKSPFNGAGPAQICAAVLTQPVPLLSQYRHDVPPALESIMRRCLERDREKRYPNVTELAVSLSAFSLRKVEESPSRPPAKPVRRRRRRWLGATLSLLVLGGCGAVLVAASRGEQIRLPTVGDIERLPATISAWKVPFLTPTPPAAVAPIENAGPEGAPNRPLEQRALAPAAPLASASQRPRTLGQIGLHDQPKSGARVAPTAAPSAPARGSAESPRSPLPPSVAVAPTTGERDTTSPAPMDSALPALPAPGPIKSDSPYDTGESDSQ